MQSVGPSPNRLYRWLRLLAAVGLAFLVHGHVFCMLESTSVLPPATLGCLCLTVVVVGFPLAGLDWLVGAATHARFWLVRHRRWLDARCPWCGHPMPPRRVEGVCNECGGALEPPAPPRRLRRLQLELAAALLVGSAAAHGWLALDLVAFRGEVAARLTEARSRPRVAPFRSAGLVYSPGRGISAHD